MTAVFVTCAAVGGGLLLLGILFDGVFDGLLDSFDLDGGGVLSVQVVAAFVGAFGLGGLAVQSLSGSALAGVLGGLIAGVALGWVALRLTRSLMHMATDPTPTLGDVQGATAKVVTPIAAGGSGEVLVRLAGQQVKLTARCDQEVPYGASVVVLEVLSPSSVRVEPEAEFWNRELGEGAL